MTLPISIYNVLSADIVTRLVDQLETSVSDESKVFVFNGVLKGLATDNRMTITVQYGDETRRHTLNVSSQNVGAQRPLGEIGGLLYWRQRYSVHFDLFFAPTIDQATAKAIAGVVVSRARWALQNQDVGTGQWWFSTDADAFGERADGVQVMDVLMTEGGSEKHWTWRGEIRLEFITEAEGCV